ncbi:hypothetical protein FRC03_010973, partial [Tulasnella sp. 419]
NHTRHHVKACDYPGVVTLPGSKELLGKEDIDIETASVRGVIVKGLTAKDIELLDVFEGDEYKREETLAYPLSSFTSIEDSETQKILSTSSPLPQDLATSPNLNTFVYIWAAPLSRLSPTIWDYDAFVKEKLWRWVDQGASGENSEYGEVDRRRNMAGAIVVPEGGEGVLVDAGNQASGKKEIKFGHPMRKEFGFAESHINLNNGSYGAPPLAVTKFCTEMGAKCEERPDVFFRKIYQPILNRARERVAKMLNAEPDEIVVVPNASHGIHTVLQNFEWEEGDVIVGFSTTYGAVSNALKYLADKQPKPTLSIIELTFPTTAEAIIKQLREHLQSLEDAYDQKVVVVLDAIISNPGIILPWEEMVKVCREERAWTVVDAAHAIGQIDVDLGKSQPDFWVSNGHKWLMSKRGSAVLYVPRRNQHLIRSSFPTPWSYVSPPNQVPFPELFEWTGTLDLVPFLSINAALDFRESIGGEKKIRDYCNDLAFKGGKRMAEILGTSLMDESGEMTGHMTNVLLPLPVQPEASTKENQDLWLQMTNTLMEDYDCVSAIYMHDKKWWTRASAQIWTELSDFEYLATSLKELCEKLYAQQVSSTQS